MRKLPLALVLTVLAPQAQAEERSNLYVLAINGGGDKLDNFASHLAHLRQLVDLLSNTGVPREHITVLSSDGSDPSPDLATREPDPENAWLLRGTRLDSLMNDLTIYENSVLPGIALRPATRASLARTIAELRTHLHANDTLLVYVTDHGTQSLRDPLDNRITLWGARESISVRKFGALLARLPSSVRVVSLMSQCFSGGFAYLHEAREHKPIPTGSTCGYFSSTSDRPSYGCYPEVRGQKAIGHSFEFLSALARHGRFPAAHDDILLTDETPDIPMRSSDVYLSEQIARTVGNPDKQAAFLDPLLKQALASGKFAEERRLVDRISTIYSVARPSTITELDRQANDFFTFLDQMDLYAKTWEIALADFNQINLDAFLARKPVWRGRVEDRSVRTLDAKARQRLVTSLLDELAAFVTSDTGCLAEGNRLIAGLSTIDELAYRTEIRLAALLRMRFVLTKVAGQVWLKHNPNQGKALDALTRCEDLSLPVQKPPRLTTTTAPQKLPPLVEDQRRAATVKPGWLGITYVPVSHGRRKHLQLPGGAAQITSVLPRSPAAAAGLRVGDIATGQPGHPFSHPNELRPFIVSSDLHAPLPIEVLRGKNRLVVRPIVGEMPFRPARN